MTSLLQVDVFVSPPIYTKTGHTDPAKSIWSPISCTLIHGPSTALLVDTPTTISESKDLAAWIKTTIPNKKLLYIYTTHAHPDHFMGAPVIQEQFPEAKFISTPNVVAGIGELFTSGTYEAVWPPMFPEQLHPSNPVPAAMSKFQIDGHDIQGIEVGHTDNAHCSFVHVPSLKLVVSGDIVYGECHQHFGEASTTAKRREWLDAIDAIEALGPQIVVAGHKRATQIDGAYLMEATREYIHTFERELNVAKSWEALFNRMVELYPMRWNLFILEFGCKQSFEVKIKERL